MGERGPAEYKAENGMRGRIKGRIKVEVDLTRDESRTQVYLSGLVESQSTAESEFEVRSLSMKADLLVIGRVGWSSNNNTVQGPHTFASRRSDVRKQAVESNRTLLGDERVKTERKDTSSQ